MEEAKNLSGIWNIVNDINKSKDEQSWKLIEDDNIISDERLNLFQLLKKRF